MSSATRHKFFHSFVFYLALGYITVYGLCALSIYFIWGSSIAKSARSYDRQDVMAETKDLLAMLEQNGSGSLLAEAVTLKHYPPSTIFAVRVINAKGEVEYTMTWPAPVELPPVSAEKVEDGFSEFYIRQYDRHLQVQTTVLKDGRALQVAKGSFLEADQKAMLEKMLNIFGALSTVFSFVAGLLLLLLTIRPIRSMRNEMTRIIETGQFETGAPPVNSLIAELDTLCRLFNVMTGKYANLILAMRQTMDNVAHDFRTPLTRIRGTCELALRRKDLPEGLADELADVIDDCDGAKMQLQNLMDAREMESGFASLSTEHFSLSELLSELADMYSVPAEEKEIVLTATLPEAEVFIEGDRQRLARAFANLLDNAVKYTPKHGQVSVLLEQTPDGASVRVSDTGIGIPEDERGLIWQRLFRGRKARASQKGLGLGLNIVHVIIAAHGGTIEVESESGKGTTFLCRLPGKPRWSVAPVS